MSLSFQDELTIKTSHYIVKVCSQEGLSSTLGLKILSYKILVGESHQVFCTFRNFQFLAGTWMWGQEEGRFSNWQKTEKPRKLEVEKPHLWLYFCLVNLCQMETKQSCEKENLSGKNFQISGTFTFMTVKNEKRKREKKKKNPPDGSPFFPTDKQSNGRGKEDPWGYFLPHFLSFLARMGIRRNSQFLVLSYLLIDEEKGNEQIFKNIKCKMRPLKLSEPRPILHFVFCKILGLSSLLHSLSLFPFFFLLAHLLSRGMMGNHIQTILSYFIL